jgi:uncharacterized membrane protein (UPF0127 family)
MMSSFRIWNPLRNTIVVERARVARTHWERTLGLLGKVALDDTEGLLLQGTRAIHTFGMQFPIDVIYLDEVNRVLCAVSTLPPNRIGPWQRGVHSVLELRAGRIAGSCTQVGDFLVLKEIDQ